jgi:hypothetical protein
LQRGIEPLGASPWQGKLKRGLVPDNTEKQLKQRSVSALQRSTILQKNIVAMALESPEDGTAPHVSLTQLPSGAEVAIVGEGFNDRTVKVHCNDRSYFVFMQDIEGPDSSYYLP